HRRSAPTLGAALDLQAKLRTGTASTQAAPLFEAYAAEWKRTYRGRNGKAREATLAGYRWVVDNELVAHFGRMRLDRIGPADVREWLAGLAARGLARGTCGLRLRVLRLVFACAVEDELIHRNPCQHVRAAYTAPDAAQTEQGRA